MADEQNTPEVPTDTPPGPQATTPVDTGAPTTPPAADASAEPNTQPEGEGDESPKPPKQRGGFQKRIHEQTAKIRTLERQLAEVTAAKPAAPAADVELRRENFSNYEDFIEAKAIQAATKTFADKQRETTHAATVAAYDARVDALKAELTADAAADPIFAKAWETVSAQGFPVSDAMGDFIAESDDPNGIIEWLANNRAEAEKLYSLPASQVARALARVEARQAQAPPARTPQAPPPPPTVGGRSTPRVDLVKLASASNPEDYIAKRREQMAKAH